MEIEYKGANAVILKTNKSVVCIDPKLSHVGLKDVKVDGAIELATESGLMIDTNQKILISGPGEYEASLVSIKAIAARRHLDEGGTKATIYSLRLAGFRVAVLGNIADALSDDQLEALGVVDFLIIPVGGGGFTLDAHAAAKLVLQINPKVIIPTHYNNPDVKYEVPQNDIDLFVKEVGATQYEQVDKYKLKPHASLPEILTIVEIKRT